MNTKTLFYLTGFFLITFTSCFEDAITDATTTTTFPVEETIVHDIKGRILHDEGDIVAGANVMVGSREVSSDDDGNFSFQNVRIPSSGSFFLATQDGKIPSGSKFYRSTSLKGSVNIVMKESVVVYTYDSRVGGSYEDSRGALIHFPANGILQNGNPYDGEVRVIFELELLEDPIHDVNSINNHDLLNDDGSISKTLPIRRFYLELIDASDQPLTQRTDQPVVVVLPNVNHQGSEAASLYQFNQTSTYWEKVHEAPIADGFADLDVVSTGWFQLASESPSVELCLTFSAINGTPGESDFFYVYTELTNLVHVGIVEYGASICFTAPTGETLHIEVLSECLASRSEILIDISDTGPQEAEVVVDLSYDSYTIAGDIFDCNNALLSTELSLSLDAGQNRPIGNFTGSYEFVTDACDRLEDAELIFFDPVNQSVLSIPLGQIEDGVNTIDVTFCHDSVENTFMEAGGTIIPRSEALQNKDETLIRTSDARYLIGIDGFEVGTFTARISASDFFEGEVQVTTYDDVGGVIEGTFTGMSYSNTSITGSFRSERIK